MNSTTDADRWAVKAQDNENDYRNMLLEHYRRHGCPSCERTNGHSAYCRANEEPSRIKINLITGARGL